MKKSNHRKLISELVLEGEEHPSMQGVIEFAESKYMDGYEFAEFFFEICSMQDEGIILYDGKHDTWIWTGISNDKLRKLVEEGVKL